MSQAEDGGGTIERLLFIKALPLFAEVPPEELAIIAEHTQLNAFRAGETLFTGTEAPVTAIHLVLDGSVSERRGGRPFRTHGAQRVLGGLDALALASGDIEAVADEDTRTLSIERAALRDILEDSFGILSATLQGVAAATLRLRRLLPSAGFAEHAQAGHEEAPALEELAPRLAFLRGHTWLGGVKVRALGQLAREAELAVHGSGERLWSTGEPAEHALIVVRGVVAGVATEGQQRFAAGRGTILGLEEALAMDARWYDATTRGPTVLLSLTRTALIDTLEDDSDTAVEVLAGMAAVASELRDRAARETA